MTSTSVEGWWLEVEGRRIDLRGGEATVGRSRGCGVVLRDPSVSRNHALLSVHADHVTLQDLRSSNGTYVNGKRLEGETALGEGDRVVIGETALYLRRAQPDSVPAAAAMPSVLPVGEALGAGSASWEQTTFRHGAAAAAVATAAAAAPPAPSRVAPPPPAPATVSPPAGAVLAGGSPTDPPTRETPVLSELPMSVREAERSPSASPSDDLPPPPPGLLQRLAERLGLSRRA